MRCILITAGVPKNQINIRDKNYKIETLARAYDWLHEIKLSEEYEQVKFVWNLLPEETWKQYKTLEIEGLREQQLLEEWSKKLLKLWKTKRPRLFGHDNKK